MLFARRGDKEDEDDKEESYGQLVDQVDRLAFALDNDARISILEQIQKRRTPIELCPDAQVIQVSDFLLCRSLSCFLPELLQKSSLV